MALAGCFLVLAHLGLTAALLAAGAVVVQGAGVQPQRALRPAPMASQPVAEAPLPALE